MNMKLNPNSTRPQISKHEVIHPSEITRADIYEHYEHPWYKYKIAKDCPDDLKKPVYNLLLNKPNPPTKEAIERAKFVDRTYVWDRNSRN